MSQRSARIVVDADVVPRFTACYLRVEGDECAFIEAHTRHALPRLLAALADAGRRPEDVRYVVVTHAHLDHAAGAGALVAACPRATLLAHPRAAKHLVAPAKLVEGARQVYGEARFAELYGEVVPVPAARVRALADGASFELGGAALTAHHTYGHAFHHLVVDDPAMETVFTGDTFGLIYPDLQRFGRFALPSTSPTGFEAAEAEKSLARVLGLGERLVAPTHFDVYPDQDAIAAQLRRFLARVGAWVDEAARGDEAMDALEARFVDLWWAAIAEEAPRFGPEERKLLALDVELNARGAAHAAVSRRAR